MGEQEKKIRKKRRIGQIEKVILSTIVAAGFLSIAVLAPNTLQVFGKFGLKKNRNSKYNLNRAIRRLLDKKLIVFEDTSEGKVVRLTNLGERVLREIDTRGYKLKKPRRWDKKWRIIVFDIKEGRKGIRDKLRKTLIQIGFVRLQNSVWVYPYDCEDLIKLLKADFRIGKDVLYVIADSIENDAWIRRRFGL